MDASLLEPVPEWLGRFVALGPAEFWMGAADADRYAASSERPLRNVRIRHRFALGVFPVTTEQWNFAGSGGLPKTGVSARDIGEWLQKAGARCGLSLRLPSEAEWEYAARAGAAGGFPSGDHITPAEANFLHDDSKQRVGPGGPTLRGSYPPNAFGLEDMVGNVAEWVDGAWSPDLGGIPEDGRATESSEGYRVVRSAGWDALPRLLRLSARYSMPADRCQDNLGFRLAFDLR